MKITDISSVEGSPIYAFAAGDMKYARPLIAIGQKESGTIWIWDGHEQSLVHIKNGKWESQEGHMNAAIRHETSNDLLAYISPLMDWDVEEQAGIHEVTEILRRSLAQPAGKRWLQQTVDLYK